MLYPRFPTAAVAALALTCILPGPRLQGQTPKTAVSPLPGAGDRPDLVASRVMEGITLDGHLREDAWRTADEAGDFTQADPTEGEPATESTIVKILYDDRYLYVGAILHDSAGGGSVRIQSLRRDFDWESNDVFGVALDPFGDGQLVMAFLANGAGVQRDLLVFDGDREDENWNGVWELEAAVTDEGWSLEMAIPWETLRYPADGGAWRLNFHRVVRRKQELSGWAPWPRTQSPFRMEYGGRLTGLMPPPPSTNLRFTPYALTQGEHHTGSGEGSLGGEVQVGGDVKWALSPSTVLDLTVNTDFAQAESDRAIVNLSRFNVRMPETRPFFQENSGLLAPSMDPWIHPFYSRKVGLDDSGNPVPIVAGARLVSQGAGGSSGLLLVRQGESTQHRASTLGVGRYSRPFRGESRIGALATLRHDELLGGGTTLNSSLTSDLFLRLTPSFLVAGLASATLDSGEGGEGTAGYLRLNHTSSVGEVGIKQSWVSSGYSPASGFLGSGDYASTSPRIFLDLRPDWKPASIRAFYFVVMGNLQHRLSDGALEEAALHMAPLSLLLQGRGNVELSFHPQLQSLQDPFTPLDGIEISAGKYTFTRSQLFLRSDPSQALSGMAMLQTGAWYDGAQHMMRMEGRYTPTRSASLGVSYSLNALRDVGEECADRNVHLLQPEVSLSFSPRAHLSGLYQWSSASDLRAWNLRFSWEFSPLSYLHVVYNDLNLPQEEWVGDFRGREGNRQLVVKLSYLAQF